MNPRYQIVLQLTEEEANRLKKIREKNITIIDVFRAGLTSTEKSIKKS